MNTSQFSRFNAAQCTSVPCLADDSLTEYINAFNSFKALCIEHRYKQCNLRDKDKEYRDNYLRSFIHRHEFSSASLNKFKANVMHLNRNRKEEPVLSAEQMKAEQQKHAQNLRASMKRGIPKFDLFEAKKLL